jgi:photosystem II stability/assembly factor-like uncharacterized protein
MGIERALLIGVLIGISAPAIALGSPSASPSPVGLSKGAEVLPQKSAADEDSGGVGGMKLIAPGIGWAERDVGSDSPDGFDKDYYWTADNGAHWKNVTPHAAGKGKIADFFFLDTYRGWAIFEPTAEQDPPLARIPLTLAATTDAGATWTKTPLTLRLKDYLSKDNLTYLDEIEVSNIAFADAVHGWLLLAYKIGAHGHTSLLLVTSDGGKTWKKANSYPGPSLGDMALVTPDQGWVFGGIEPDGFPNSLFVTRDGAKNWQELSAYPITNPGDVKEWHETVLRLGDAEGHCEIHRLPMVQDAAHAFLEEDCAVDVQAGDPVSMHTTVLFATDDAGRTWKPNRTLTNFVGQCGSSTMVGSTWIAPVMKGGHVALLRVAAEATVDAGEENGSIARYSLCGTSLSFVSLTQGWMLTDNGMLRSTIDGGRSWTTLTPGR